MKTDKLPATAYVDNTGGKACTNTDAPIIGIKRGEMGCRPIYTHAKAEDLNLYSNVTPAQAAAMHAGSVFGWDIPAADPDNYDANGNLKP